MSTKFRIQDWAGNVLDYRGKFLKSELAVPMAFDSFEDGWGWIYENIPEGAEGDGTYDDIFVVELEWI